jgi:hypothetical protein
MVIDQNAILLIVCLIIGYLLGRLNQGGIGVLYSDQSTTNANDKVIKNNTAKQKPLIKIDETKFVTEIDTNSMEKKFDNLGDIKTSTDNVSESINKLKNLKR